MAFDMDEYLNYVHKQQREMDEFLKDQQEKLAAKQNRLYKARVDNLAYDADKLLNNKELLATAQLREYKDRIEFVWVDTGLDKLNGLSSPEQLGLSPLITYFVSGVIMQLCKLWEETEGADTDYRDRKFYEVIGHKISCAYGTIDPTGQLQGPFYKLCIEKNERSFLQQLFGVKE